MCVFLFVFAEVPTLMCFKFVERKSSQFEMLRVLFNDASLTMAIYSGTVSKLHLSVSWTRWLQHSAKTFYFFDYLHAEIEKFCSLLTVHEAPDKSIMHILGYFSFETRTFSSHLRWSYSLCFSRMVSCHCCCSCIGFSHFEHWWNHIMLKILQHICIALYVASVWVMHSSGLAGMKYVIIIIIIIIIT